MLILTEKSWKSKLDLDLDLDLIFVTDADSQHYKGVECLLKRHQMIGLVLMRPDSPFIKLGISHQRIWLYLIDKTMRK